MYSDACALQVARRMRTHPSVSFGYASRLDSGRALVAVYWEEGVRRARVASFRCDMARATYSDSDQAPGDCSSFVGFAPSALQ